MRAGRLLSILILLQLRVRLTAQELASELEVSERTIYRDIDELGRAGIPIYADRGPGGGFQLVDGYRTRLTGLASAEAEAVFMIGLPAAAEALGLGAAAESAGRKLLAALPSPLSEGAERLSGRFHLDLLHWYRAEEPVVHLPALARAVLDARWVSMTYESWKGLRAWRVEPLGLVLKAGAWYVVARSGDAPRIFKVANVRELTLEEATFVRPEGFDLGVHWRGEVERFESELRPLRAQLRLTALGAKRLARSGSHGARAIDAALREGERLVVELPIESIDQAAVDLLALGPEVEVLLPVELREELGGMARRIAEACAGSDVASRSGGG
jgi:predicted DNA-binding transcriptional regulator YafY